MGWQPNADTNNGTWMNEVVAHATNESEGRYMCMPPPASTIADLCMSFYYGTDGALGHLFPEAFGKEVPTPAVVLVLVAVHV